MQQRNEMMDSFAQILRRLPTGDTSSLNICTTPFKVQINFDIPIFEGQIDVDVVDKWLNLLEGYFSVHKFSNREMITFALLKVIPHVKDWWETFTVIYIDTSIPKWKFWTSHPWARPIDMSSKSSRRSNKRRYNLGLVTPHNKIQEREAPTHRIKDRAKMDSIRTTSPSRKQGRTPERQRKIAGSGVTSIRALGITLLTATQKRCWWPK
jgi:hypothetical protein